MGKQIQNIQYTTPGTGSRFSNNHAKNSPQTSSPWRRRTVTKSSAWLMGETFPTLTNERRNQRPKRRLNRDKRVEIDEQFDEQLLDDLNSTSRCVTLTLCAPRHAV